MKKIKLVFDEPDVSIKITKEQALLLGINYALEQQRGDLVTQGPWNIAVSYKALCCSATYTKVMYTKCTQKIFYGQRKMSNVKQGGYELEGYVSIGGKKHSCFTSSQMFEIEGKLIDVAVIHARIDR